MKPELYTTLRKIAAIQAERRANWKSGEPASAMLESAHQLELSALRHQLSDPAPRVRESESTPTSHASLNPYRGGARRLVGNLSIPQVLPLSASA